MFRDEIGNKTRGLRMHRLRLGLWESGRVGLALRFAQMYFCVQRRRRTVLSIAWIKDAHGCSIRSVA
jgi:hypothetical protein